MHFYNYATTLPKISRKCEDENARRPSRRDDLLPLN